MNIENMCLIPVMIVRIPVMREAEKDKLREKIVSGILDGVLLIEDGLSYEVVDLPMEDRRLHHHAVINWTGPGDYDELRSLWHGGGYETAPPLRRGLFCKGAPAEAQRSGFGGESFPAKRPQWGMKRAGKKEAARLAGR